ncbi:unnamed protein product [Cuscuta europaea]|uniref:Acyl-CoA-binding domain-containing protein n=1 Tax=Cuscuta europaea TaxID=41803 RepID=A0A9P0ZKK7_CUSEU|nr:unnamed protein product [Cuscuta europaea]
MGVNNMFGLSRRRTKLGRLKVQLSDAAQGTKSPIRNPKRLSSPRGEAVGNSTNESDDSGCHPSTGVSEFNDGASGSSENWMVLSISGEKPIPRFNHSAAVIGNKMVVVGGESGSGLLEDVQVLNFDRFSWTAMSSKPFLSPTNLPLKIPACKGHSLVPWGKKVLLVGGKTDPACDKVSVWAFDTETESWSLMESKGDVPLARSGHTVVRASSVLILFGGEDSKRRKLNDLYMFDLKSLTWLPLHCTGAVPPARSNHVITLYDDKLLLVFGGTSKSRTLNDLHSLDFETMVWSRVKIRGFHPSPRAGCCGVLCGTKWYIAGGGSKKKRHAETLIFDVLKLEWSVVIASHPSSIITNKGFSLVLVQHKERDFLVAFGGFRKEPSNQVEVLMIEKSESSMGRKSALSKVAGNLQFGNRLSSILSATQPCNNVSRSNAETASKRNPTSAPEHGGSGRKSLSESLLSDPNSVSGNVSLRKQFYNEGEASLKIPKSSEDESSLQVIIERETSEHDKGLEWFNGKTVSEEVSTVPDSTRGDMVTHRKQGSTNFPLDSDGIVFQESDGRVGVSDPIGLYQSFEAKLTALLRKNGLLEGQLAAALASREVADKSLSSALKSKLEIERKLADATKEMELLKEKLAGVESAHEESNSLSNIVHSDNVRLEHDVAFLKAVLDDTQKELHSTRGVLAGERARAFQLQVEVFHLKQRLQSLENRTPTPRKQFHV